MIQHIRIQNYRSLVDVSVDLEPLTVLIGRSGTGKTNFVNALRLLRRLLSRQDSMPLPERSALWPMTGNASELRYTLRLAIPSYRDTLTYSVTFRKEKGYYPIAEELSAADNPVFRQESGKWVVPPPIQPTPGPGELALGKLSGLRPAMIAHVALTSGIGCYDFPGNVIHTPDASKVSATGYADDGSNFLITATGIVQNLHQLGDWAAVTDSLRAVNPSVAQLGLHEPERDRLDVAHKVGDKLLLLDAAQESEGFRRFLAHMLALYQTPPKQTVIFEHPEHAIHPGAMTALFEEFQSYVNSGRGQVILTTHSPQLLDHFAPDQIRVVDIENQETRIGRLAPEQAKSLREKLLFPGELLTVDPARLSEPLAEVPG